MTKKIKIILAICAVVLVGAITGLTIAIVVVASQAQASASMKVTFVSFEVSATVTCSAYVVDMYNPADIQGYGMMVDGIDAIRVYKLDSSNQEVDSNMIEFKAGQGGMTDNIYFAEPTLDNYKYAVRYQFQIVNNGNKPIKVVCATDTIVTNKNMRTELKSVTDGTTATDGKLEISLASGQLNLVYLFVRPDNIQEDGTFDANTNGALSMTFTGV